MTRSQPVQSVLLVCLLIRTCWRQYQLPLTGLLRSCELHYIPSATFIPCSPILHSLVASPVTSYADQILSIHRNKSSDGFSLDIPCIMLIASILKVFYWFGIYYSMSLLLQACLMIIVQAILLKVALDNRPSVGTRDGLEHNPFSEYTVEGTLQDILAGKRPFDFWRWSASRS